MDPLNARVKRATSEREDEEEFVEVAVEEEAREEEEYDEEEERKWPDKPAVEVPRKYEVIGTVLDKEVIYPEVSV